MAKELELTITITLTEELVAKYFLGGLFKPGKVEITVEITQYGVFLFPQEATILFKSWEVLEQFFEQIPRESAGRKLRHFVITKIIENAQPSCSVTSSYENLVIFKLFKTLQTNKRLQNTFLAYLGKKDFTYELIQETWDRIEEIVDLPPEVAKDVALLKAHFVLEHYADDPLGFELDQEYERYFQRKS